MSLLERIEPWKSYARCHGDTSFCPYNLRWRQLWIKRLVCSWLGHDWGVTTHWGWHMCGRCTFDETIDE